MSEILQSANALVCEVLEGRMSIREFVKRYGDFYYAYALDGHESDPAEKSLLSKFQRQIDFHARVQQEVVNLTFDAPPDQRDAYLQAGRITDEDAAKKLITLASEFEISSM